MTTLDAQLMVGGYLHAQHCPVRADSSGSTRIAFSPRLFTASWTPEGGPLDTEVHTEVYNRKRFRSIGGCQSFVWATPDATDLDLQEAVQRRGIPGLVSVLLPSRGRASMTHQSDPLRDSINSLLMKAVGPIEILIATDPDDMETWRTCQRHRQLGWPLSIWEAPERYGYSRLNEYFNALETRACGEWVLLWNDDARMLTEGWDQVLRQTPDETMIADLWIDGHSPDLCTFPAVRRHLIAKVGGGFSPWTCHCDTWWQDIGRALGVIRPVEIKVDHQRSDLRPGMHLDLTRREALSGYRSAEFYGEHVQSKMHEAIERAAQALYEEKYR